MTRIFIRFASALCVLGSLCVSSARADGPINVVATLPDLGKIAEAVGGDKVSVTTIASGVQDPHFVDPKPSFVVKLRDAELLLVNGLDLEVGWVPPLLDSARNGRIKPGAPGYIDCSKNIAVLELPTGTVTRAEGDVHPLGNPHYLTDPLNGKIVADTIAAAFTRARPSDAAYFAARKQAFQAQIDKAMPGWIAKMHALAGARIVFYHKSYSYFVHRFGLSVSDFIEQKAGIQPGPTHLAELVGSIRRDGIKVIGTHPFYDPKIAQLVADKSGAKLVELPLLVGGVKGADDYLKYFDVVTSAFAQAVAK